MAETLAPKKETPKLVDICNLIHDYSIMTVQELESLSVPEKIQLVEDLWDSVASSKVAIPIPSWQKKELDRRKQTFLENPTSGMTWQEVKRSV
jgi:putative addiction module component (TIGR02574 family)